MKASDSLDLAEAQKIAVDIRAFSNPTSGESRDR
jgi:hypothetical protein